MVLPYLIAYFAPPANTHAQTMTPPLCFLFYYPSSFNGDSAESQTGVMCCRRKTERRALQERARLGFQGRSGYPERERRKQFRVRVRTLRCNFVLVVLCSADKGSGVLLQ